MLYFIAITFLSLSFSEASENASIIAVPLRHHSIRKPSPWAISRIVGGRPAFKHEFPWQASVLSCNTDSCEICGGSLISKRYVLTAGHCVHGLDSFNIGLGSNSLFGITTKTNEVTIHEGYNPRTLENDVALLKLPEDQELSETIQTIDIADSDIGSLDEKTVRVSGYGKTSDSSGVSETLNTVNLQIISNSQCRRFFGSQVRDTTMCAVGSSNSRQSICSGDSGGPLVLSENGKNIQVGVVSFVSIRGCAKGYPSGYARVSTFSSWIKSIIGSQ